MTTPETIRTESAAPTTSPVPAAPAFSEEETKAIEVALADRVDFLREKASEYEQNGWTFGHKQFVDELLVCERLHAISKSLPSLMRTPSPAVQATWLEGLPTEPGNYWMKLARDPYSGRVRHVFDLNGHLRFACEGGEQVILSELQGDWVHAGPVPHPDDAQKFGPIPAPVEPTSPLPESAAQIPGEERLPPVPVVARNAVTDISYVVGGLSPKQITACEEIIARHLSPEREATGKLRQELDDAKHALSILQKREIAACQGALSRALGKPMHDANNSGYASRSGCGDAWERGWMYLDDSAEFQKYESATRQRVAELEAENAELRENLKYIGELATAHHGDQESHIWFHGLTVDIPHVVELALEKHPAASPVPAVSEAELREIVESLVDAAIVNDSLGVDGSNFRHCLICQAATDPGKGGFVEHDKGCPVIEAEAALKDSPAASPAPAVSEAELRAEVERLKEMLREVYKQAGNGAGTIRRHALTPGLRDSIRDVVYPSEAALATLPPATERTEG